jgi:hypothetical protein
MTSRLYCWDNEQNGKPLNLTAMIYLTIGQPATIHPLDLSAV